MEGCDLAVAKKAAKYGKFGLFDQFGSSGVKSAGVLGPPKTRWSANWAFVALRRHCWSWLKSFEKSQCCFDSGFNRGALPQKYQFEFLMAPSQDAIIIFKALSARLNLIHYLVDRCYLFPSGSFGMSLFCSAFRSCPIPSPPRCTLRFDWAHLRPQFNFNFNPVGRGSWNWTLIGTQFNRGCSAGDWFRIRVSDYPPWLCWRLAVREYHSEPWRFLWW